MRAGAEERRDVDRSMAADDLTWLADRLVLGELGADQAMAAEARLGADEAFAAAVTRSSRLISALLAAGPATPSTQAAARGRFQEASGWRRLPEMAAVLAGSLALVVWLATLRPAAVPQPRDMLHIWRQVEEADWLPGEGNDETALESDVVPEWMHAALTLGVADSRILEN